MFGVPEYEIATGEYENAIQEVLKHDVQVRRDALEEAKQIAKDELFNTMILLSFPEQSSAAWTIMWKLDRLREGQ